MVALLQDGMQVEAVIMCYDTTGWFRWCCEHVSMAYQDQQDDCEFVG